MSSACSQNKIPVLPANLITIKTANPITNIMVCKDKLWAVSPKDQTIQMISLQDQTITGQSATQGEVSQLIKDNSNQVVYAFYSKENALTILEQQSAAILRKIHTGAELSLAGGAIRPGSNQLWICDGTSSIWILTTPGLQLLKKIEVGRYPENILFSPEGNRAYVTLKGENAVAVILTEEKTVMQKITVGIYPRHLVWAGAMLAVSNFGSKSISLLDVHENREKVRIRVRKNPNAMVVEGDKLWVACEGSFRIIAIQISQAKVMGSYKLGLYPNDLIKLPDGRLVISALQEKAIVFLIPEKSR